MKFQYYFGFTKSQYKGLIVLLAINFFVIIYYFLDDYLYKLNPAHDFSELIAHIDSIESIQNTQKSDTLFYFDPNAISTAEFNALGLEKSISKRIAKYKAKGGQFRKTEDLKKIYGMDSAWFYRIEPYIKIEIDKEVKSKTRKSLTPFLFNPNTVTLSDLLSMGLDVRSAESWVNYLDKGGSFKSCEELEKLYLLDGKDLAKLLPYCELKVADEAILIIDLNSSDSVSLLNVKGIGPTFAHRIIEYRSLLGGFVNLSQLKEIYGIDSLRYSQIEPQFNLNPLSINKVRINADEFKVLLRHPYLSYEQVKSIVNYRNELGELNNLNEVLQLEGFKDEDTIRLKPYISFEKK